MHVNNFAIRNNKNSWALGSKSSSKTDRHHWAQQLIDQCSYNLINIPNEICWRDHKLVLRWLMAVRCFTITYIISAFVLISGNLFTAQAKPPCRILHC